MAGSRRRAGGDSSRRPQRAIDGDRTRRGSGDVRLVVADHLFPAGVLTGLAPNQVRLVIAHELAHIRRHDYLLNLVQTAVETVFFFHPGVWWLSKRIREERENCCDDVVVAELADGRAYAAALVDIERWRSRRTLDLAIAAGGGNLLARIARLIDEPSPQLKRIGPLRAAALTLPALLAVA